MHKALEEYSSEELISYIGKLRKENGDRRSAVSTYDKTFSKLAPDEQRGLLHIIEVFADDRQAGADLFRRLSESITPPTKDEPVSDSEIDLASLGQGDAKPGAGDSPALLAEIKRLSDKIETMEKASTEQAEARRQVEVAEIVAKVTELGYTQGTPEWDNYFQLAQSDLVNGDLDMAHRLYGQFFPAAEGEGEDTGGSGGETGGDEASKGAGESKKPEFPVNGAKNSSGSPKVDPKDGEEVDLSKEAVNARALAYLEAAAGSGDA